VSEPRLHEAALASQTLCESEDNGSLKHGHVQVVHNLLTGLSNTARATEKASSTLTIMSLAEHMIAV
jgi:hypothetical protein